MKKTKINYCITPPSVFFSITAMAKSAAGLLVALILILIAIFILYKNIRKQKQSSSLLWQGLLLALALVFFIIPFNDPTNYLFSYSALFGSLLIGQFIGKKFKLFKSSKLLLAALAAFFLIATFAAGFKTLILSKQVRDGAITQEIITDSAPQLMGDCGNPAWW